MSMYLQDAQQNLEAEIDCAIAANSVQTWVKTSNGYTHSTPDRQWFDLAYLRFTAPDRLELYPNKAAIQSAGKTDREVYAVYHGRFAEMLLSHFSTEFTWVCLSSS